MEYLKWLINNKWTTVFYCSHEKKRDTCYSKGHLLWQRSSRKSIKKTIQTSEDKPLTLLSLQKKILKIHLFSISLFYSSLQNLEIKNLLNRYLYIEQFFVEDVLILIKWWCCLNNPPPKKKNTNFIALWTLCVCVCFFLSFSGVGILLKWDSYLNSWDPYVSCWSN